MKDVKIMIAEYNGTNNVRWEHVMDGYGYRRHPYKVLHHHNVRDERVLYQRRSSTSEALLRTNQ